MKDPLASVKVIVPDRMQMAYWKKTLSRVSGGAGRGSGFIGTAVISFSKLAMEILDKIHGSPVLIPSRLDSLCIRKAVRSAEQEHAFAYFDPIREKPGLLSVLEQTIHTLQRGCIAPEMLASADGRTPKTADTVRVYRKYLALTAENNWIGSAGLLSAAATALGQTPAAFDHCPLLVVDGFNELTKDCVELLCAVSAFCDEILITLPADPDSDDPTDQRILKNAEMICTALKAECVVPESFSRKSELLDLADRVFYPKTAPSGSDDSKLSVKNDALLMIEASSRTTEVRETLRELKRRILESEKDPQKQIRPVDCAVFVPDMKSYAPVFRQFGREMGIPLRFSQKQKLSESPAASALKRLLHLVPDFEIMKVLSVLRQPFFSGNPDPAGTAGSNYGTDLFVLDHIGRKMNVIRGIDEWKNAFAKALDVDAESRKKDGNETDESDEGKVYEYPDTEKLERIRDSFVKFAELISPPEGTLSRTEWVRWLENVLKTIRFYEQIKDRSGHSFESDFRSLLKRIIFCAGKLEQPPVSYKDFLQELESELDAAAQSEPEYAGNRIFVGDITQTGGCRWKLVVLTGFAEGVFPRAEHEDLILTDALRNKLGIASAMDQQLFFHHAVTRADSGLIITRPRKTDKGEEWPPSIYWQMLRDELEENANLLTVSENTLITAASPEEFAFRLARSGRINAPESPSDPESGRIRELLDQAKHEMDRWKEQTDGIYAPVSDPLLKDAIADPVKDAVPYSCSAIETWLTCPFKYFLMKKLRLEAQQEPRAGMDAAQTGSLNHKVMELTFAPGTVYASKNEALESAEKNIETVFASAPEDFEFRESELWAYEKDKYRQKLLDTIEMMFSTKNKEMPMNSQWMSIGAEMKFGYPDAGKENADPLLVETSAGPIRIRGIIDRVDQRSDGLLRVVDYKTGDSGFSAEELAAGSHIQAGVYAAAVVHALQKGRKCEVMYWSINKKKVLECFLYDSEKTDAIPNIEFLNKFAEGIRDAAFPAEPAGKSCPDYCPAAAWCRKYMKRTTYYG